MSKLLPSPPLSIGLFLVWLLLEQSLAPATLLLGLALAIVVPILTRSLRPATVRMRKPLLALRLLGTVGLDLSHSALTVSHLLLTRRTRDLSPRFVRVPLDARDPNVLAVLSMILCLTPGTAWGEVSLDRTVLLVHLFDSDDDQAFIDTLKSRYERPLMEIFES